MTVVYDTGVLVAADRNSREVWAEHRAWLEVGIQPVTTAPVVAQASRSPRQVQLRRFLRGCRVVPLAEDGAHAVGKLLGEVGASDVVDAHVALTGTGGLILTSDPLDLNRLAASIPNGPRIRAV